MSGAIEGIKPSGEGIPPLTTNFTDKLNNTKILMKITKDGEDKYINTPAFNSLIKEASYEELQSVDVAKLNENGKSCFNNIMFEMLKIDTEDKLERKEFLTPDVDVVQRFTNIPVIKETAVIVGKEGDKKPPYLHANFVQLSTNALQPGWKPLSQKILTQCPMPSTQEMFWKCALENSNIIVDLTRSTDSVKPYFPQQVHEPGSEEGQRKIGDITVTCRQVKEMKFGIEVHQYHVKDAKTGMEKEITRIHYPNWPDHGGVSAENLVQLEYLKALEDHTSEKYPDKKPTTVYCRAGIGRSGTYTVSAGLIEFKKQNLLTNENSIEVIKDFTLSGREQRGKGFVQTAEQLTSLVDMGDRLVRNGAQEFDIKYELLSPREIISEAGGGKTIDRLPEIPKEIAAVSLIYRLATEGVNQSDVEKLEKALNSLTEFYNQEGELEIAEKDTLYNSIKQIKKNAAKKWDSGNVYMMMTKEEQSDALNVTKNVVLSDELKTKINFTMNVIFSNVPEGVKNDPAYHNDLIKLGKTDRMKIFHQAGKRLFEECRNKFNENGMNNATYLFRDSSTHTGPEGIHTFSMSYCIMVGKKTLKKSNYRLAFNKNTNSWQMAMLKDEKRKEKYDVNSDKVFLKKNDIKLSELKERFPARLTFDNEGNVINKFDTLEVLAQVLLSLEVLSAQVKSSEKIDLPPDRIFSVTSESYYE